MTFAVGVRARLLRRWRRMPSAEALETLDDAVYGRWLARHDPTPPALVAMREAAMSWERRPLVSILVPVFDPEPGWLEEMFASVSAQIYDHWELCIADDASTRADVVAIIRRWEAADPRITAVYRSHTGNIAAATNSALGIAHGEFVAFLDHDDVLRPHALHRVVEAIQGRLEVDVVYSDEDKLLPDGRRARVSFKGGFDPDHLLSTHYMSHLSVFRRTLVDDLGGLRPGFEGSQDHDLALRVSEHARQVAHIADVLYSWRQVPGSTATAATAKPKAWSSGLAAVQSALDRRAEDASALPGPGPGTYVVRYRHPATPSHVIVHGGADRGRRRGGATSALRRDAATVAHVSWDFPADGDYVARSPAARLNAAAQRSSATVLIFVDADLEPAVPGSDWLGPLLEQALRPGVGACGGFITAADGSPEYEGWHIGPEVATLATCVRPRYAVIQGTCAVPASCMAIRAQVFAEVGGFDESYVASGYDIDLSLRLRRLGLRCVCTPLSRLRRRRPPGHVDSAVEEADRTRLHALWLGDPLFATDPYASPWVLQRYPLHLRQSGNEALTGAAAQVVATDHSPPNST